MMQVYCHGCTDSGQSLGKISRHLSSKILSIRLLASLKYQVYPMVDSAHDMTARASFQDIPNIILFIYSQLQFF